MQETQTLATFVADTRYADLPASLIAECKIATLDVFAAAFVGSSLPWAQRVVEMVHELGGAPEVTVVNQPWKTDISRAALANGAMIGAFECEPLTGSHASGTVLPAVLAVCQRDHRDGKAFLLAIALGFELSGRLQKTAVGLESTRGFHNPGIQGPFGAAALNSIFAADRVLIPISADYLAVQGAEQMDRTLRALERMLKTRLVRRYVITRFDGRRKMSWEIERLLRDRYGADVCESRIAENVSIAESPSRGCDIFKHAPASRGAHDYEALLDELVHSGFMQ